MAGVAREDASVLSDVFATVWRVGAGGLGNYRVGEGWVWRDAGGGGADFPAVFLLELDEDERNVPLDGAYEAVGVGGEAVGSESGVGGVASAANEFAIVEFWKNSI